MCKKKPYTSSLAFECSQNFASSLNQAERFHFPKRSLSSHLSFYSKSQWLYFIFRAPRLPPTRTAYITRLFLCFNQTEKSIKAVRFHLGGPVGAGIVAKITKTTSLSIRRGGKKGFRKRGSDEEVFLMLRRTEAAVAARPAKWWPTYLSELN